MKVNNLEMTSALFAFHRFEKVNLTGDKHGADIYECMECGIKCKRPMMATYVNFATVSAAKLYQCVRNKPFGLHYKAEAENLIADGVEIVITEPYAIPIDGIAKGDVYKTVVTDIPKDFTIHDGEVVILTPYKDKYKHVKLLSHEFKLKEKEH